ncbi:MAG: ABC transporter ATP-binding protein [Akkermansiaceae bacterium]|jgi:ABC-2 type transport system ATP-binding protein|nr:ABC transporter ATP-binding protein [Akkermansiaceae bacterium]MDG1854799.1 ABC transporter ATP-binding protein [Verrucomicrobiales bacterium]
MNDKDSDPAIHVNNLSKSYGSFLALKGIDLTVNRGEVFGFLGPNGAGKTTAIRCMLDLIRPDGGTVSVLGKNPQSDPVSVRKYCGYLPGELRLDENTSVHSVLEFLRELRGGGENCRIRAQELAERLDLNIKSKIKNLSKGNKQKVGIIAAFMNCPDLLLLDEPTSGLDPLIQQTVLEMVRESRRSGATVFFSSHVLAEVQAIADRVAIIREGQIVEVGETSSLLSGRSWRMKVIFAENTVVRTEEIEALTGILLDEVSPDGRELKLMVDGEMDDLIKVLAGYHVESIETGRPDLEEVFLSYYGEVLERDQPGKKGNE